MTTTTTTKPKLPPKPKPPNATSRLRLWICECTSHVVDTRNGRTMPGPYKIRLGGDGLLAQCQECETMFRPANEPPTGRKRPHGCAHCSNPEAHVHADLPIDTVTRISDGRGGHHDHPTAMICTNCNRIENAPETPVIGSDRHKQNLCAACWPPKPTQAP